MKLLYKIIKNERSSFIYRVQLGNSWDESLVVDDDDWNYKNLMFYDHDKKYFDFILENIPLLKKCLLVYKHDFLCGYINSLIKEFFNYRIQSKIPIIEVEEVK